MGKKIKSQDCLIEILTEELPPKSLLLLVNAFKTELQSVLEKESIAFRHIHVFATPRRLALLIESLAEGAPDRLIYRKGPAFDKAYDANGNPTSALLGFANSIGVKPTVLTKMKTGESAWVGFEQNIQGEKTRNLLPALVEAALQRLPIAKKMRWGNRHIAFVRPVHNVVMLYGRSVIPALILGCQTNRHTMGHRFLSPKPFTIKVPNTYISQLKKHHVIVDFNERREKIIAQAKKVAGSRSVLMQDELLNEVTSLVEWPFALLGNYDKYFLQLPREVLISAMQDHQRYFPVMTGKQLSPHFVVIANLAHPAKQVIRGYERVLRARLKDAVFFYEKDQKIPLENRLHSLKGIVFQEKLGSLYDKAERLKALSKEMALYLSANTMHAERAGLLAKVDLTTQMVDEFPSLQGIMGGYYALSSGESPFVAHAIKEHYFPRFAGDTLPESALGQIVGLSDRIDTLVGIFGLNQIPTGEKDPFGLRRLTLGLLRILIEKKLHLDLKAMIQFAMNQYQARFSHTQLLAPLWEFIMERLRIWYLDQGIASDVFRSVTANNVTDPYDIHLRVCAVQVFKKMTEARSLCLANKRVTHILSQYQKSISAVSLLPDYFEHDAEKRLAQALDKQSGQIVRLSKAHQYAEMLVQLASLSPLLDHFFDEVMVMVEDEKIRENRLLLLARVRALFLQVADIALLQ